MKLLLVLALAVLSVVSVKAAYTGKFTSINVDEILTQKRLLQTYVDCVLETKKRACPSEANELRSHIVEALENECANCSPKQRTDVEKIIGHFINDQNQSNWNNLCAKFDPNNHFRTKYEARLRHAKKA